MCIYTNGSNFTCFTLPDDLTTLKRHNLVQKDFAKEMIETIGSFYNVLRSYHCVVVLVDRKFGDWVIH